MITEIPSLACLGDSITAGVPGVSYTKYLKTRNPVNFGLGGDTVSGLSERIKTIDLDKFDRVLIEIGTNDILLPYLESLSGRWRRAIKRIYSRGSIPLRDPEAFRTKYEDLLKYLSGRIVTAVSIPCIGENIGSSLNRAADEYNLRIKELCGIFRIKYIDFNNWQKQIMIKNQPSDYFIHKTHYKIVMDCFLTGLGFSEIISRKRGLVLTMDGVHLNSRGAQGLASLISQRPSL